MQVKRSTRASNFPQSTQRFGAPDFIYQLLIQNMRTCFGKTESIPTLITSGRMFLLSGFPLHLCLHPKGLCVIRNDMRIISVLKISLAFHNICFEFKIFLHPLLAWNFYFCVVLKVSFYFKLKLWFQNHWQKFGVIALFQVIFFNSVIEQVLKRGKKIKSKKNPQLLHPRCISFKFFRELNFPWSFSFRLCISFVPHLFLFHMVIEPDK